MNAKDISLKMQDKNFRREFTKDANACIEKHFGESINADIIVKRNTKDVFYMVIPYVSAELTLNQLGNIQAAGVDVFAGIKSLLTIIGAAFVVIGKSFK